MVGIEPRASHMLYAGSVMYYIPSFTQNFFKSDYGTEFQDYKRIK
jgi:hypothetical protein